MSRPTRIALALACAAAAAIASCPIAHAGSRAVAGAAAHPYHVAYAEVTPDRARGVLLVAMRLWPEDLQRAVRRHADDPRLDIASPEANGPIASYLGARFLTRDPAAADARPGSPPPRAVDPDAPPVSWVGKEIGVKHAWIYFETPLPSGAATIDIANTALFDVVPNQENTIELRLGERRLSAVSTPRDPWTRLRLDRGADSIALLAGTLGDRLSPLTDPLPLQTRAGGPLKLLTLRLPEPEAQAPAAAALLEGVARSAPLLIVAEDDIARTLRRAFAADPLGPAPGTRDREIVTSSDGPASPVRRATAHLASPGAVVAVVVRTPGGSTPANRVANALRSLEPERNVRAAVARTDRPIGPGNTRRLADLRGLPAPSMARWADAAGQRGPIFPEWLVIEHHDEPAETDAGPRR